jgi:hypothetical protein
VQGPLTNPDPVPPVADCETLAVIDAVANVAGHVCVAGSRSVVGDTNCAQEQLDAKRIAVPAD